MTAVAGLVSIVSIEVKPIWIVGMLGDGRVKVSGGYGGWELVDRPKNISITRWSKSEPYRMAVPILFDGFARSESVEGSIRGLELMARRGGGDSQPPILRVALPGSVPRSPNVDWVINDITWGDMVEHNDADQRIRADCDVEFLQWVDEEDTIDVIKKKKKGKSKKKKTYVVKRGDTLPKIAAKLLHKASRWHEIATLNHIRDPLHLKVGKRIKIP